MSIEKFQPSYDIYKERMKYLKKVVPEAFADGKINWVVLKEALGNFIEEDEGEVEHYAFTWPGKRQARRLAGKPPQGTLVPVPGEGVKEESTENIFIEGDNLEVLKLLQKSYAGKIKMIYIDPPYNTGKDFVYSDNFTTPLDEYLKLTGQIDEKGNPLVSNKKSDGRFHSKWLNMMYPRLSLVRNLLRDDGVIFISIDDNEVDNLKKICNEVFGEENFVEQFIVRSNPRGNQAKKYTASEHEYIICYAKEISLIQPLGFRKTEDDYNKEDKNGKYREIGLRKRGAGARREDAPNQFFPIYYDPKTNEISTVRRNNNVYKIIPYLSDGSEGRWRWSKKSVEEKKENLVVRKVKRGNGDEWDVFEKDYYSEDKISKIRSILYEKDVNYENATEEIKSIFNGIKVFDYPKPVYTLKKVVCSLRLSQKDIILDFFAGSCPAAHAVLDLNKEDGGNLKFIMVQLPEKTDEKSEAYKAGFKTIADIGKERIRRVIKKIQEERGESGQIDLGFKVFKLQKSHFKEWKDYEGQDINELADLFAQQEDALVEGWKPQDLVVEIMLQEGFPLHSKISSMNEIKNNKVIQIKSEFCNHVIFVCLDGKIEDETINDLPLTDKDIFICLDKALTDQQKVSLSDKGVIKTI